METYESGRLGEKSLAFLVVDSKGAIKVAEGDGLFTLGLRPEEVDGRSVFDVVGQLPGLMESIKRALAGEGNAASSSLGGANFEVRSEPRYDGDRKKVVGALMIAVEQTEPPRKNERAKVDDGSERVLDQLPVSAWATNIALRITHASGRFIAEAERAARPVLGATVYDLIDSEDAAEPAIAAHLAALSGERAEFQYKVAGRCYEVRVEPLRDDLGEVIGCVGAATDVTPRRRLEKALVRTEARLADTQRIAHVGSWEWDVQRNRIDWSEEMYRVWGLAKGEFRGTYDAMLEHVHPDDLALTGNVLRGAVRDHEPFTFEHRIVRPDGETRVLHTSGEVVADARGNTLRVVGSCLDVTERTRAARDLERGNSLLRASIESTADGILVVDRTGKIATYNKRFTTMWRLPEGLILQGIDRDVLSAVADQLEDPDAFLRRVHELYDQPDTESFDVVRFHDGRVFERFSQPQRLGSEVVGRVWSFRDVTERERLLRRAVFLSDASRLLASLEVERALEGVAQLAVPYLGDGCAIDLLSENGGPRRLLSISRDSTKSISTVLPRAVLAGHALVYPCGLSSQMAVPLMARGDMLGVITFSAPSPRRYNEVDLALAEELGRRAALAIENVGLFRKATEALRARDEFLSIAAHELRGPVTSLHLAVQSMVKGELAQSQIPKVLDLVAREDRRLLRFVDELLDVARIRTGRLHFDFEEVDLAEVTREVAARMSSELSRSGSSLRLTTDANVIGHWDRARLDQVVTNLLSNAIKFGLGKPIEVSVTSTGEVATLVIADRGIGVPQEMVDLVFEPFERAVSTRHYGGLGLGLYIVRTILDGLGGSVSLDSRPGKGSTFTIELPQERTS